MLHWKIVQLVIIHQTSLKVEKFLAQIFIVINDISLVEILKHRYHRSFHRKKGKNNYLNWPANMNCNDTKKLIYNKKSWCWTTTFSSPHTHTPIQWGGWWNVVLYKKVIKRAGKFFFLVSFAYCGINKK